MADAQKSRTNCRALALLAWLLAFPVSATAQGAHGSPMGATATAKVQLRLSVRPVVRVGQQRADVQLPNSSSSCLWSNFPSHQYGLRAEWSDGRTDELASVDRKVGRCAAPNLGSVDLQPLWSKRREDNERGGAVLLMIEGL